MEMDNSRTGENNHETSLHGSSAGTIPDSQEDLAGIVDATTEREFADFCKNIESYDWGNDNVYQQALQRMSQSSQLEPFELEQRAKCFYWARRFKVDVDYPKYKAWKLAQGEQASTASSDPPSYSKSPSTNTPNTDNQSPVTENPSPETLPSYSESLPEETVAPPAPYPHSFDVVVEMIQSGRGHLLPGIKTIPPTVLTDKFEHKTMESRKKPWETEDISLQTGSGMFGDRRDIFIRQDE